MSVPVYIWVVARPGFAKPGSYASGISKVSLASQATPKYESKPYK